MYTVINNGKYYRLDEWTYEKTRNLIPSGGFFSYFTVSEWYGDNELIKNTFYVVWKLEFYKSVVFLFNFSKSPEIKDRMYAICKQSA